MTTPHHSVFMGSIMTQNPCCTVVQHQSGAVTWILSELKNLSKVSHTGFDLSQHFFELDQPPENIRAGCNAVLAGVLMQARLHFHCNAHTLAVQLTGLPELAACGLIEAKCLNGGQLAKLNKQC